MSMPALAPPRLPHYLGAGTWEGDKIEGSWTVRIERCRLNTGFMFIGVCDAQGRCAWGLHPFSGLLYRLSRKDQDTGEQPSGYGFEGSPPAGYPDGNRTQVMVREDGVASDLRGRARGAVIETLFDTISRTLSFRINGGPVLKALSGFPPDAQLRMFSFLFDQGDRLVPLSALTRRW